MTQKIALLWFRQDLRLKDNPALTCAVENGFKIIPVFVLDDDSAGEWAIGGASRWWLHQSLQSLNKNLQGRMIFLRGDAAKIIPYLAQQTGASAVMWNRCYEPWRIARDKTIKDTLKLSGLEVQSFNASLLWEPWDVLKSDGTPYKVFTPYYRNGCLSRPDPAQPLPAPATISYANTTATALNDLRLMPSIPWHEEMEKLWQPGEDGAAVKLQTFIESGLQGYKELRNRPDMEKVSSLSPHLHFGEISVREAWHTVRGAGIADGLESDMDCFCSELGWREFSHYLLYHFPALPREPLQQKFKGFPWARDDAALLRWQRGQTGIPMVDAGMRQLWQTGWMHNRVRMIVASFLVKNLRIHWHHGEDWFWDCLLDADLASNSASWQWVAGCGADAAPYFRIFNPVTQGEKFDPEGDYIRRYIPELRAVENKYIHRPWDSPNPPAGYPPPLVDLKESRQKALDAYQEIR